MILHKPNQQIKDNNKIINTYLIVKNYLNLSPKTIVEAQYDIFKFQILPNSCCVELKVIATLSNYIINYTTSLFDQKTKHHLKKQKNTLKLTEKINYFNIRYFEGFDLNNYLFEGNLNLFIRLEYQLETDKKVPQTQKSSTESSVIPFQGIVNNSSKCFINVSLQLFFHLSPFRKYIYNLPNTPLFSQLQIALCWLQSCTVPAHIEYFIDELSSKSFFNDFCSFLQFMLKLFEEQEGDINQLYQFKTKTDRTKNSSSVFELGVCGYSSLEDFFNKFSIKTKFIHLPKIFFIHTDRITFQNGNAIKLTDKFLFPTLINMKKYVDDNVANNNNINIEKIPDATDYINGNDTNNDNINIESDDNNANANRSSSCINFNNFPKNNNVTKNLSMYNLNINDPNNEYLYSLYAVVCHAGSTSGGHYTIYIHCMSNDWIFFDDNKVRFASENEVINGKAEGKNCPVLLVYVKTNSKLEIETAKREKSKIIKKMNDNEFSDEIKQKYLKIKEIIEKKEIEMYTNIIKFFRLSDLNTQCDKALTIKPQRSLSQFSISSRKPIQEIFNSISKEYNYPIGTFRVWMCDENKLIPISVIRSSYLKSNIGTLLHKTFFIEKLSDVNKSIDVPEDNILIIIKYFDEKIVELITLTCINVTYPVSKLEYFVKQSKNLTEGEKLIVFAERDDSIIKLKMDLSFISQNITKSGTTLIFQRELTSHELLDERVTSQLDSSNFFKKQLRNTVKNYIDRKYNMIHLGLTFNRQSKTLSFPRSMSLPKLTKFITHSFDINYNENNDKLLFFNENNLCLFEAQNVNDLCQNSISYLITLNHSNELMKGIVIHFYEGNAFKYYLAISLNSNPTKKEIINDLIDKKILSNDDIHYTHIFSIISGILLKEINDEDQLENRDNQIVVRKDSDEMVMSNTESESFINIKIIDNEGQFIKSRFFFKIYKGELFENSLLRMNDFINQGDHFDFILKLANQDKLISDKDELFSIIESSNNYILAIKKK